MGILDSLVAAATGGLGESVLHMMEKFFPADISPEQKTAFALAAQNIELQRAKDVAIAQGDAERALNERIAMYEGTASDLRAMPVLGPLLLMLRGAQRPVWGFGTLYLDYGVFSGLWSLPNPTVSNAFWMINVLVLGFLFGERALANVLPLVKQIVEAKRP